MREKVEKADRPSVRRPSVRPPTVRRPSVRRPSADRPSVRRPSAGVGVVGWGGWGGVKLPSLNATLSFVHSHPPSHNIGNTIEENHNYAF